MVRPVENPSGRGRHGRRQLSRDTGVSPHASAAALSVKVSDRRVSPVTAGRYANLVAALSLRGIGPDAVPPMEEIEERFSDWEAVRR